MYIYVKVMDFFYYACINNFNLLFSFVFKKEIVDVKSLKENNMIFILLLLFALDMVNFFILY